MVNNTDSIYPKLIPIEYPVAGEKPSVFKIGVVSLDNAQTKWMNIADDAVWGSYAPRMEWADNNSELIVQHLNRRQNESNLMVCNAASGAVHTIYTEKDSAWIDIVANWDQDYANGGWDWLNGGKEFLWAAEKDGWRHLYRISRDGKKETLITKGRYDVMDIAAVDERGGYLYFHASPENATQKYLYRTKLNGTGNAERLTLQTTPERTATIFRRAPNTQCIISLIIIPALPRSGLPWPIIKPSGKELKPMQLLKRSQMLNLLL